MNRQQRRKIERQNRKIKKPSYRGLTHEEKLEKLFRNGITADDLKQEWHNGFHAGFQQATPAHFKTIYAAIALAAHEQLGFGPTRCKRLLDAVDSIVLNTLCSQDAIDEVLDKLKLHLQFEDPTEDTVEVTDG